MTQPALLDDILKRLTKLDPKDLQDLAETVDAIDGRPLWTPNPGSQTEAFFSEADDLGFGGEAGPGKTDLLIGLSLTTHVRSLILRRTNKEARKLAERYQEIIGHRQGLNTSDGIWRLGRRVIDYGGVEHEDDKQKYKGTPRDLIAFDEVVDFTRSQFEFIKQWNRSRDPDQRCRTAAAFNPPTRPVGLWVLDYWGPWLDPRHPRPAKSGELRWYTTIDGRDTEVDGPGPHEVEGEMVMARSRTFVRGYLHENPYLEGYDAVRTAAPKELRSAYRSGDFEAALADVPGQLIPTAWVRAAQARWTDKPPMGVPMCAMGVDCSGGGDDPMMIAIRHDGWFAPLIEVKGADLPSARAGAVAAGIILSYRRDNASVIVDMGGGYGGPLYEKLHENHILTEGYKGAEGSRRRTQDRKLGFVNRRSAAYWGFREALDPDQPGGSPIALDPTDSHLVAELTAHTFEVPPRGIMLETKEKIIERLGRSPNRADAVVMAWEGGVKGTTEGERWRAAARQHSRTGQRPEAHHGYANRKRRRR